MKRESTKSSYVKFLKQKIMRRTPSMVGDSTGAGVGALVGFGLGGPLAVVGGAAVGSAIGEEVEDILQRTLSKQERRSGDLSEVPITTPLACPTFYIWVKRFPTLEVVTRIATFLYRC